jgi:predicted anti-sigma-YlaC factor YlaD
MRLWLMITCRQAQVLLSQRQDGALGTLDRYRLRLHLSLCDWCSRISRQFQFLSDAIRRIDR